MGMTTGKVTKQFVVELMTQKDFEVVSASNESYFNNIHWLKDVSTVEYSEADENNRRIPIAIFKLRNQDFVELEFS